MLSIELGHDLEISRWLVASIKSVGLGHFTGPVQDIAIKNDAVRDGGRCDADVVETTEFHKVIAFNPKVTAIRNINMLPITPNQKSAGFSDLLQRPKKTEL